MFCEITGRGLSSGTILNFGKVLSSLSNGFIENFVRVSNVHDELVFVSIDLTNDVRDSGKVILPKNFIEERRTEFLSEQDRVHYTVVRDSGRSFMLIVGKIDNAKCAFIFTDFMGKKLDFIKE